MSVNIETVLLWATQTGKCLFTNDQIVVAPIAHWITATAKCPRLVSHTQGQSAGLRKTKTCQ